ncbi:HD-GYP domain-containing protein [Brevibacillus fluminis]|uniref:HD-GYP domain-containing protein n=1 Tax=Brevibacillus fluminis TaxID=511487 RepID=A0A3M8DBK5_9BACL|nr:HD-GYP domain-containing protein [Brevibacillus fluminis]RNB85011.1 HD-GYP domain-containing protein [Brevibacillus fluminis]
MRLTSIHKVIVGEQIAKPIYSASGITLIGEDVHLTQRMIDRLKMANISYVYIKDKRFEDLVIPEVVSEQTRREAMGTILQTFQAFQAQPATSYRKPIQTDLGRSFRNVMGSLIDELKHNEVALSLLGSVCGFDHYVFTHSFQVTLYAITVALRKGFNQKELMEIGLGAILHDIGKMMVPYEILSKPGRLTEEEYFLMKKHAEYGFEILRRQDNLSLLTAHCAFQHHERFDGSGYPRNLTDLEIHPYAKIIAICDVYDALTSNRAYRNAMLPHEAIEVLYAGVGTNFSKELVEDFKSTVALYPLGISVVLTTGETGVVINNRAELSSRPLLRIYKGPDGQDIDPYELDLAKNLHIMIVSCE